VNRDPCFEFDGGRTESEADSWLTINHPHPGVFCMSCNDWTYLRKSEERVRGREFLIGWTGAIPYLFLKSAQEP
jgi:hypothetical protein